ncbi:MAG: ABC transporter substrate-binding protein, partial [Burkholderiales bacterium]
MQNKLSWLLILLVSLISACTKAKVASHPKDTLRIDVGSEAPTLDPQLTEDTTSSRILFDLFAGLVDFDQQNRPISGMAKKWEISKDGKTYTFHLRRGLKFSDGTPITASDFVYSWQRVVTPKTASPYNYLLANVVNGDLIIQGKKKPTSLGVAAPDQYTFVVRLVHPDPAFIAYCMRPNLMVVPKQAISKFGLKWTEPQNIVTSGAYVLNQHVMNGYILATKNPYYYAESSVKIYKIKYLPYVNTSTSLNAYRAGGVDMTFKNVPIDQLSSIKRDFPQELHIVQQEGIYYLDLNMKLPLFAHNSKLRQALTMAIDRKILTQKVMAEGQVPLYSLVTPTIEGGKYAGLSYAWANWSYESQVHYAQQLYKAAGFDNNHPLSVTILYNTNDMHKKLVLAVAAMWHKALGVKVKVANQDWATFLQARRQGDYIIARDGWLPDYDSVTAYTLLYLCNGVQ